MQRNLDKRLAALEAAAPARGADTEPATEEDWLSFCCDLFRSRELWFDDAGDVIVMPAKHAYSTDSALLADVARAVNEWRCQDGTPAPFLPMMPDEATQLLDLLHSGHVVVNAQIHPPTYPRIEGWYKLRSADLMVASSVARELDPALKAFLASGGRLEYTVESIMDLLMECVNDGHN